MHPRQGPASLPAGRRFLLVACDGAMQKQYVLVAREKSDPQAFETETQKESVPVINHFTFGMI